MKNILWELFEGRYDITPNPSAEQQELWKKICVELDKVQGVCGDEWIGRLLELEGAQAERQMFQCCQAGFRLGAQLMLEALGA